MNVRDLIRAGLILAGCAVLAVLLVPENEVAGPAAVIDGDTVDIFGTRIRLAGIDAPELGQTCGQAGTRWACGQAAQAALVRLVGTRNLRCTGSQRDSYGRLVARCAVMAGDARDVAAALAEQGLALASGSRYRAEEQAARAAGRGLWSGPFDTPKQWRADHPR